MIAFSVFRAFSFVTYVLWYMYYSCLNNGVVEKMNPLLGSPFFVCISYKYLHRV